MESSQRAASIGPYRVSLIGLILLGGAAFAVVEDEDWLSHLNPIEAKRHQQAYEDYASEVLAGSDVEALRQLALMATWSKDWSLAGQAAAKARSLDGDWGFIVAELAAWVETQDHRLALDTLLAAMAAPPSQWTGWQSLPSLMMALPDKHKALTLLERLDAQSSTESQLVWRQEARAKLYQAIGESDQALAAIRQAIISSPSPERVMWGVELAQSLGDSATGMTFLDHLDAGLQMMDTFIILRAELCMDMGLYEEAIELLRQVTPTPRPLYYLASLAAHLGRDDLAMEAWQALPSVTSIDSSAEDAFFAALVAQLQGHLGQAWTWFGRVTEPPWLHRALLVRGALLHEFIETQGPEGLMGSVDEVRRGLWRVRQEGDEQQREQSWLIEGYLLQQIGQDGALIDLLSEALVEDPDDHFLLYLRAIKASQLENMALAEQDLRRIIRGDGGHVDALNALGYLLTDRTGRHREAHRLIHRALELRPNSPEILDSMGWVYFHLGQLSEALSYLEQAYALSEDPEIQSHLIEVLLAVGDEARALEVRHSVTTRSLQ